MLDNVKRFDMKKPAQVQHLRPLMWLLCFPLLVIKRNKLTKINMEGIKPPYLLLCNHNAFMDFYVATKAIFPHRGNYVVAIDGFLKREWLLRFIGCICKRKFTRDIELIRQLRTVIKRGDIAIIYPEARYSLCGTTAVIPASVGKLARLLGVPVVTLMCHGHHINSPFYNLPDHGVKNTRAEMTCLLTPEDLKNKSASEIQDIITKAFEYDDFKWQKENNIRITYKKRAEGLHKVLYQCACCGREYKMISFDSTLKCQACGKQWQVTELGELEATDGDTEFSHIPDWYEWERVNVRAEVERGEYYFSCQARVDSLPNPDRYIDLGTATFTHSLEGFRLEGDYNGERYLVEIPANSLYSVHIEYEYLGKFGDCVDLNTLEDTLYTYPKDCEFSVTKIALATEEIYDVCCKRAERERQAISSSGT